MSVILKGKTENYSDIEPRFFKVCALSIFLMRIIGEGGSNLFRGFPNPIKYYKYFNTVKPDVIIVRNLGRWFSILAILCAKINKSRIIIYTQGPLYRKYNILRRLLYWIILNGLNAVWMTPVLGDKKEYKYHPKYVYYIPFTVKIMKEKKSTATPIINILSIGKFQERKNHLLLLNALKTLSLEGYDFKLRIIGEVSDATHRKELCRVQEMISDNSFSEQVEIYTNIPNIQIQGFYEKSDFFVLASRSEPASISILEAIGFGLPVICSNKCGTRWYINEGQSGFWFQEDSLESLSCKIRLLMNHETLLVMKKTTLKNAHDLLDKDKFYSLFMEMIYQRFPELITK